MSNRLKIPEIVVLDSETTVTRPTDVEKSQPFSALLPHAQQRTEFLR